MLYACTVCFKVTPKRQCPRHQRNPNAHRSPNRDRGKQAKFRKQVLANAGHRCEAQDGTARCPVHGDRNLRACHIKPLANGGSYQPDNGRALCKAHDMESDPHAR